MIFSSFSHYLSNLFFLFHGSLCFPNLMLRCSSLATAANWFFFCKYDSYVLRAFIISFHVCCGFSLNISTKHYVFVFFLISMLVSYILYHLLFCLFFVLLSLSERKKKRTSAQYFFSL